MPLRAGEQPPRTTGLADEASTCRSAVIPRLSADERVPPGQHRRLAATARSAATRGGRSVPVGAARDGRALTRAVVQLVSGERKGLDGMVPSLSWHAHPIADTHGNSAFK